MHVFRIDREKRRQNVLTGMGAFLNGGRWNQPGQHVVYTASSRSLAILEMLVHFDLNRHFPHDRIMAEIYIPEELIRSYEPKSGTEWRKFPYQMETQRVWEEQNDGELAGLQVPSAILPEEMNLLINPNHPSFHQLRVVRIAPLDFDRRLA